MEPRTSTSSTVPITSNATPASASSGHSVGPSVGPSFQTAVTDLKDRMSSLETQLSYLVELASSANKPSLPPKNPKRVWTGLEHSAAAANDTTTSAGCNGATHAFPAELVFASTKSPNAVGGYEQFARYSAQHPTWYANWPLKQEQQHQQHQHQHRDQPASRMATRLNARSALNSCRARLAKPLGAALPPSRTLLALLGLASAVFTGALDTTIVSTAIPQMTDAFHSTVDAEWYAAAFFLTLAAFQSFWGKLYKYFSLKAGFLAALAVFEVGSLICGCAASSTVFIVGRAIGGIGGAGVIGGAYSIISFVAPQGKASAYAGILGAIYGFAAAVGPELGGALTQQASWRWCFWINLPIGGVAAVVVFVTLKLPESSRPVRAPLKEKIRQLDVPGSLVLVLAVVCYLLALQWGGVTKAWDSLAVVSALEVFIVAIAAFVAVEYYAGSRALLPPALLRRKQLLVGSVYTFFQSGSFFILLYFIPVYFQSVQGATAAQSGTRLLPLMLSICFTTVAVGELISRLHWAPPWLMLSSAMLGTIGSGCIYTLDVDSPSSQWIGFQILVGFALGLGFQVPVIVAQMTVAPEDISSASAMLLFSQMLGGALLVSAGQAGFANRLIGFLEVTIPHIDPSTVLSAGETGGVRSFDQAELGLLVEGYVSGLRVAFAIAIAAAGVAIIAALFMPRGVPMEKPRSATV